MQYLLVDGHSAIFAWPELRKLHSRRTALARDELVKRLTEYQDASGVRAIVVFDGKGEQNTEQTEPGGIQVFYSAADRSADSVIERLVAKYGHEHDLTVVTNDLLEKQTTISFGAHAISVEALRALLGDAAADLARRLKKHRRR
jgi:predicted RNA-binding protein with PIN domain